MSWHTLTVTADGLAAVMARVRRVGGTITAFRPLPDGSTLVTYVTSEP